MMAGGCREVYGGGPCRGFTRARSRLSFSRRGILLPECTTTIRRHAGLQCSVDVVEDALEHGEGGGGEGGGGEGGCCGVRCLAAVRAGRVHEAGGHTEGLPA